MSGIFKVLLGVSVVWFTSLFSQDVSQMMAVGFAGVGACVVLAAFTTSQEAKAIKKAKQQQQQAPQQSQQQQRSGQEEVIRAEQRSIQGQIQSAVMVIIAAAGVSAMICRGLNIPAPPECCFHDELVNKLALGCRWLALSAFTLFFAVVNVGSQRYPSVNTPSQVTDGGKEAKWEGEEYLRISLSFLSNTSEQLLIHVLCVLSLSASVGDRWTCFIPILVVLYVVGRVLFYIGYTRLPVMRAFGFSFSVFPSCVTLIFVIVKLFYGVDLLETFFESS
eukprot:CAMPEP_0201519764 /NCGR_PEP_ID=MMETSP0161_2-20130828/10236_1 /ASSEMBLY_ACC=CAM_ASM_000251 /TAXON_ID=180227 /ORGANISM="Neoparamoeba aestuarina, Strain SoJaBio B1-5/56/2" /LENGTH=276 /DNA_ID=CAMNT_0047917907 /DNA_START=168 /DNA_END=1001 /DNA_ORIENTATION=-